MQSSLILCLFFALICSLLLAYFQYFYKEKREIKVTGILFILKSLGIFLLFLLLINPEIKKTEIINVDGVFIAIGHSPSTEAFSGVLDMDEEGYIIALKPGTCLTNIDGVFAAGDCVDKVYRQAVTAAGMGCMAALDAEKWIQNQ